MRPLSPPHTQPTPPPPIPPLSQLEVDSCPIRVWRVGVSTTHPSPSQGTCVLQAPSDCRPTADYIGLRTVFSIWTSRRWFTGCYVLVALRRMWAKCNAGSSSIWRSTVRVWHRGTSTPLHWPSMLGLSPTRLHGATSRCWRVRATYKSAWPWSLCTSAPPRKRSTGTGAL